MLNGVVLKLPATQCSHNQQAIPLRDVLGLQYQKEYAPIGEK